MRSNREIQVGTLLERAHLTSLPQPAEREDYDSAADEILAILTTLPGAVAVYRTGQVSAPGISDLDFILVIEGSGFVPPILERLTPLTRYLAMHSPAVVDVDTFVKHRWFASAEPLERAWGDSIAIAERPHRPYADILIAAEGLTTGLLRLVKQAITGRVKVRPTLCELNALQYDLRLAELGGSTGHSAGWQFVDEVRALRASWFSNSTAALGPILRRSVPTVGSILQGLAAEVPNLGILPDSSDKTSLPLQARGPWSNVTIKAHREPLVEGPSWFPYTGVGGRSRRVGELKWRLGRWSVAVPGEVIRLLAGEATDEYRDFVDERERIVRQYGSFVSSRAPSYGMLGTAANYVANDR